MRCFHRGVGWVGLCAGPSVCYNIITIYWYIIGASTGCYILLCYIIAVYTVWAHHNIEKRVRGQNTRTAACARDRDAAVASPARVVEVAHTACLRRRERARVRSSCVLAWTTHERRDSCYHDGARWRACSVCADVSSVVIIIIVIVKEVIGTRALRCRETHNTTRDDCPNRRREFFRCRFEINF